MRKMLIGLLVVGSLSTFADDSNLLTIVNKTDPREKISITCEDEGCEFLNVKLPDNSSKLIEYAKLEYLADKKVKRDHYVGNYQRLPSRPYDATKNLTDGKRTTDLWDRGYEKKAILRTISIPFVAVGETIVLPFTGIADLINYRKDPSKKMSKKYSKKVLKKIKKYKVYELKEKRFNKYVYFFRKV